MSDGGKIWKFTLVDEVAGRPEGCLRGRHGISRTFATDVISNGPTYILQYLDIPKDAEGAPPTRALTAGPAEFDKAVTCEATR